MFRFSFLAVNALSPKAARQRRQKVNAMLDAAFDAEDQFAEDVNKAVERRREIISDIYGEIAELKAI